jgi:hypothetical protein
MIKSIKAKIKLASYNVGRFITNSRTRRHIINKFADKMGLIYFGAIDQKDELDLIRGFTLSQSHQDNHYSVGTINDRNVRLVDRSDAVWDKDGKILVHNWLIMAFELKTKQDLPHFFIQAHNQNPRPYETFFRAYPTISKVHVGTFEDYSPEFTSRFELYARPNMAIKTERLIPANEARVLGAHFWPYSAEQNEHVLYVYSCDQNVSLGMLETMMENGLWLANHIDRQAELI